MNRRSFLRIFAGSIAALGTGAWSGAKLAGRRVSGWVFDAPGDSETIRLWRENMRREAARESVFARFADPEPSYEPGRGKTVTITRIRSLPIAGPIREEDPLPPTAVEIFES